LFYVAFLASTVESDPQPDVIFNDFRGGINTKDNPFTLPFNEYLQLHEYVLDGEYGSAILRRGDAKRTDSIALTIPTAITWECLITDTVHNTKSNRIHFYMSCDSTVPAQDEFLLGQDIDSLNPAGGTDFTSIGYWGNSYFATDSECVFLADIDIAKLATGDSATITLSTGGYLVASDTGGITGLYALYGNLRKSILGVIPGYGAQDQWSSLYASRPNKYELTQKLSDFIYKGETPSWATWKGFAYIALPRQRPMITNGTRTTMLVPRAPGQVEIVPVLSSSENPQHDSTWTIEGTPRYVMVNRYADITADATENSLGLMKQLGYISHFVPLFNELALLYAFPRQAHDSIAASYVISDSVLLYILRTRGHENVPLPEIDTLFIIDSIISGDVDTLDVATFIDSIPNDSLGTASYPAATDSAGYVLVIPVDTGRSYTQTAIRDTTGGADRNPQFTAPGAPTLIAQFHSSDITLDWWPDGALLDSSNRHHIGWQYGITQFDTALSQPLMSNMGPLLTVSTSSQTNNSVASSYDSTIAIHVGIPKTTAFDSSLARIVWRRQVRYEPNMDSFMVVIDTFLFGEPVHGYTAPLEDTRLAGWLTFKDRTVYTDSMITFSAFFPVGLMIGNVDSVFEDSVNWHDFITGGRSPEGIKFDERFNPTDNRMAIVKGFFPFKDQMFAYTDQAVFRSTVDTAVFKLFSDINFDAGNGDVITAITNIGPNIIVFRSNGLVELYDPNGPLPTKGSPVDGIGCIASESMINYGGIIYFMARDGIRALSAHPVKNYGVTNPLVSRKINDQIVDGKSDSLKSTMVAGVGTGGKTIIFTYPSISKMYVYYPELDSWTTRSGSFFQATHYDTSRIEGLQLSSTMIYARVTDQRIFDFQTSALYFDSGTTNAAYTGIIETRPFKDDDINTFAIRKIGKLAGNTNTRSGTFSIKNDSGTVEVTETFSQDDPMYSVHGVRYNEAQFFTLQWATGLAITADTTRAFHIWTKFLHGPPIR